MPPNQYNVGIDSGNWAIVNFRIDIGNWAIVNLHFWFLILRSHLSPEKPYQCMSPNSVYWIDWHRPTWLLWQPVFAMHVCSSFSANQFVSICIVLRTTLVYRSLIAISFCKCYSYFGCNRFNLSIALCRFTFAIPFFLLTQSANHYASMHLWLKPRLCLLTLLI